MPTGETVNEHGGKHFEEVFKHMEIKDKFHHKTVVFEKYSLSGSGSLKICKEFSLIWKLDGV